MSEPYNSTYLIFLKLYFYYLVICEAVWVISKFILKEQIKIFEVLMFTISTLIIIITFLFYDINGILLTSWLFSIEIKNQMVFHIRHMLYLIKISLLWKSKTVFYFIRFDNIDVLTIIRLIKLLIADQVSIRADRL